MLVERRPGGVLAGKAMRLCGFTQRTLVPEQAREGPGANVVLVLTFEEHWLIDGRRHTSFLAGLHEQQVTTEHPGRSFGMQLDLDPLAARSLVGMPLHELANRTVPLEEVLGEPFLAERLATAHDWGARFELVEDVLSRRLVDARPPAELSWAWGRLRESHGRVRVGALAAELGWSRPRIVERFRDGVGLAPEDRRAAAPVRARPCARRHDALARAGLRMRLRRPVASDRRVPPDHGPDAANFSPRLHAELRLGSSSRTGRCEMADVVPFLAYEDIAGAANWLVRAFGFEEVERFEEDGEVGHVTLRSGNGLIFLGSPPGYVSPLRLREQVDVLARMHDTPYLVDGVFVLTDDIDAHAERARAAGARILSAPAPSPRGRLYRVEDLEGHRWMFETQG